MIYLHTYWQLFSSIFVTDSVLDAVFNAVAVLILDRIIESAFNKSRYFLIFFLSAILGNVLTLIQGPHYASAGASGGIFGLFAATFSYTWSTERRIDNATLGFFLVLFVGSSFILPRINWIAHLGGAIGGFVTGPLLYFALKDKVKRYESVSRSTVATNIATLVFVIGLTLLSVAQFLLFIS